MHQTQRHMQSLWLPQVFSKIQKMIQKYLQHALGTDTILSHCIFAVCPKYESSGTYYSKKLKSSHSSTVLYCTTYYVGTYLWITSTTIYGCTPSAYILLHVRIVQCTCSVVHHPMYSDTMSDKPHIKFIEPLTWISIIPNYIIHPLCSLAQQDLLEKAQRFL